MLEQEVFSSIAQRIIIEFLTIEGIPYENKKFCERFLEHIESLQTVSKAEIATLQRLDDVYIRKAFAKRLKSDSKLSVRRCISVY